MSHFRISYLTYCNPMSEMQRCAHCGATPLQARDRTPVCQHRMEEA